MELMSDHRDDQVIKISNKSLTVELHTNAPSGFGATLPRRCNLVVGRQYLLIVEIIPTLVLIYRFVVTF